MIQGGDVAVHQHWTAWECPLEVEGQPPFAVLKVLPTLLCRAGRGVAADCRERCGPGAAGVGSRVKLSGLQAVGLVGAWGIACNRACVGPP